jgi:hypothetical protein
VVQPTRLRSPLARSREHPIFLRPELSLVEARARSTDGRARRAHRIVTRVPELGTVHFIAA